MIGVLTNLKKPSCLEIREFRDFSFALVSFARQELLTRIEFKAVHLRLCHFLSTQEAVPLLLTCNVPPRRSAGSRRETQILSSRGLARSWIRYRIPSEVVKARQRGLQRWLPVPRVFDCRRPYAASVRFAPFERGAEESLPWNADASLMGGLSLQADCRSRPMRRPPTKSGASSRWRRYPSRPSWPGDFHPDDFSILTELPRWPRARSRPKKVN
jgi:hypothetical protein